MKKRFVEVPTHRLEELLEDIGERVSARGGFFRWTVEGRERVFELTPHATELPTRIRIFTSVGVGQTTARDCGKDAIRVIIGAVDNKADPGRFRPLEKGVKILRTAPRGMPEAHRVEAFITRLKGAVRAAYARARRVRVCPDCGSPMAERKGKNGTFLGCVSYPKCKTTRPM